MAEAFTLDTSGVVGCQTPGRGGNHWRVWPDLTPFQQEYIEETWEAVRELRRDAEDAVQMNLEDLGFRHLAPETLARILTDCDEFQRWGWAAAALGGRGFWKERNGPNDPADRFMQPLRDKFPPLTVYLGDDGLIYLREAAQ